MASADDDADVVATSQEALRTGSSRDVEKHFGDLLEELTANPSAARNSDDPDAQDREEAERGVREFCAALVVALEGPARGAGLKVRHVLPTEMGIAATFESPIGGYQVTAPWFELEETRELAPQGIVSVVAGRLIGAAKRERQRRWSLS